MTAVRSGVAAAWRQGWMAMLVMGAPTPMLPLPGARRQAGYGRAMPDPLVLVDHPAEHVTRVTLNRPDRLNAMVADLSQGLHEAFAAIAEDRHCRAVVVTGAGRGFSAGLDLTGYGTPPGNDGSDEARDHLGVQTHLSRLILRVRHLPQPVIAAVNGAAAGFGFALALVSDIRFAAPEAVFRAAFINMGLSNCDMGTSWLLPRLVGVARSHELMLTGRRFGADEALAMGLVTEVVSAEALQDRAVEKASEIAALSPWGVRLTKEGMWAALEQPSMRAAIEYEDRQ